MDDLPARVRRRLGGVADLAVLPGGNSGLTYQTTPRATTGDRRVVIKAVPPGRPAIGRHDMLRQARILRALAGSPVPIPELLAVDPEPPAWFAMSFVDGEAVEPVLDGVPIEPALARARMFAATEVLGALHACPPGQLGEEPGTAGSELARWTRLMEAVPVELRPHSGELLEALEKDVPAAIPPAIVHGDFRLGNVLCQRETPRAVVDWEIWSVGDPRADLGYFLVFTDAGNFPELGTPVPGLPVEADLLGRYPTALPDMVWFRALGRFKMAAIMGHNLRRHREGRHHNPVMERLPPTIAALIGNGIDILREQ
jgi:streptomycin 6-kinase